MSQEKVIFSLALNEDNTIQMDIEGNASDLMQLLASAIVQDEDIEKLITMALFVAQTHDASEAKDGLEGEEILEKLFSAIKPTAEA